MNNGSARGCEWCLSDFTDEPLVVKIGNGELLFCCSDCKRSYLDERDRGQSEQPQLDDFFERREDE